MIIAIRVINHRQEFELLPSIMVVTGIPHQLNIMIGIGNYTLEIDFIKPTTREKDEN